MVLSRSVSLLSLSFPSCQIKGTRLRAHQGLFPVPSSSWVESPPFLQEWHPELAWQDPSFKTLAGPSGASHPGGIAHLFSPHLHFFSNTMGIRCKAHRIAPVRKGCMCLVGASSMGEGSLSSSALRPTHSVSAGLGGAGCPPVQLKPGSLSPNPGWVCWEKKSEQKTPVGAEVKNSEIKPRPVAPTEISCLPAWKLNGLIIPALSERGPSPGHQGMGGWENISGPLHKGLGVCWRKPWARVRSASSDLGSSTVLLCGLAQAVSLSGPLSLCSEGWHTAWCSNCKCKMLCTLRSLTVSTQPLVRHVFSLCK